ncbi:hypothetical protein lerEdw1_009918 [Lerista edwardsae]|nr:hypothetical protein lerEdw1_009918 [Lerista edwardsae]
MYKDCEREKSGSRPNTPAPEHLSLSPVLCLSPASVAWSSRLPSRIQALKGSCVVIPCSFTYPGTRDSWGGPFSVAWYQYWARGYPEIYNSRSPGTVLAEYQGRTEVLGNLEMGNCTLSISNVRKEDALRYYVWINPESVSHRFYDVTVQVEVADSPKDATISVVGTAVLKEGDNVTLRCSSQANPPAISYRWFSGPHKAPLRGAGTSAEVTLVNVRRDSGPFHCVAENDVGMGEDSPPTYISLEYKPVILPQGNCTVSRTGEVVTCYCVAEGNPLPGIEWLLPNLTIPADFNSSELQAASAPWGQAIVIGELRGPASILTNVSCTATNHHGPSQITLPTLQAGDITLLLVAAGSAVGGLFLLLLLGTVIYKVKKNRKGEAGQEEGEEEDPTLYVVDGNGEQNASLKAEKPSKSKKGEQFNMYGKAKAGGSPTAADKDLSTEEYENMEAAENYENVQGGVSAGLYGNLSNWQPPSGTDQIYSNV